MPASHRFAAGPSIPELAGPSQETQALGKIRCSSGIVKLLPGEQAALLGLEKLTGLVFPHHLAAVDVLRAS